MIIEKINSPSDLRKVPKEDLPQLAREIREYMLKVISKNGGHLASSLGVVELTIALHHVFNTPKDKIIWDVGHQTYAHKIITGRREDFSSIRTFGGISGFPKRCESDFDCYDVGHSSTSLSLAVGEAAGRDQKGEDYKVVAVIGDGALTGGISFEALNHVGHMGNDVIIILNDNEHSISHNVGAMSRYLTEMISGSLYNRFRKRSREILSAIPIVGKVIDAFIFRVFAAFKGFIIPGRLFEDLGIRYFGPVDGHNMVKLIEILDRVKQINQGPKIIHVLTKKGKGYEHAETDPCRFHGIGPFDLTTGEALPKGKCEAYSSVVGRTLTHIASKDTSVVAITAAMKEGTGLSVFDKSFPNRLFDVGIAEQHGVTFSAALASTGLKPFVCIYSTFLQRAYDQLIHDVANMNLPVKFIIDRAGIVGDDGETHHGLFDISMIRNIPNFIFLAPYTGGELRDMIHFAANYNDGPIAIRFPRGIIPEESLDVGTPEPYEPGEMKVLSRGTHALIFALGDMVPVALEAAEILKEKKISSSVVNLLSIKPIDFDRVNKLIESHEAFIVLENGMLRGGLGEYIYSEVLPELTVRCAGAGGFPHEFIKHGKAGELLSNYGLDAISIAGRLEAVLK